VDVSEDVLVDVTVDIGRDIRGHSRKRRSWYSYTVQHSDIDVYMHGTFNVLESQGL